MIEESKYYSDVNKKHFNKKLVVTKKDNEGFENSKCWICDYYIDNDVKVRVHCHIIVKYIDSTHRDSNINVNIKFNNKIK